MQLGLSNYTIVLLLPSRNLVLPVLHSVGLHTGKKHARYTFIVFPVGTRKPSLNEIHTAVAKRAPLTDDDDRRQVIV
jgi:hypothetical protein